ncbi:DUF1573 domain-containing protein [Maribacter stanieri]|uniref:Ig-like domain-containing protein n=1 Tax=Maribacter stanieri TaxID=440514 RepID=UPI0030DD63E8|tara:strand:- start:3953 stop:5524 length:1572 start_codon:yes stop_codon:yes gene_type:complete
MKIKNTILILAYILVFSSCASDDDNTPTQIDREPETVIEQTAIINFTNEESNEIDFGDVVVDIITTQVFNIENTGNSDLNITNIVIPDNYTIDISSTTITPNTNKDFTITFSPTEILDYSNVIQIESNATGGNDTITITGFGVSPIYDGSIVLNTQEEVDHFGKLGYTSITGGLNIGQVTSIASTIVDLEPLNKILEVGFLEVFSTTSLENLNGLEKLNVINSIQMVSNSALKNIDALKSVTKLEGYINFLSNNSLTKIDGLENLIEVKENVRFNNNALLENIDGLSSLKSVGTDFDLLGSPLIENLNGLSSLENVGVELHVSGSLLLENLNGLSNLKSASLLRFSDNVSLYDYCGIKDLLTNDGANLYHNGQRYNRFNPTKSEVVNSTCSELVPLGVYDGNLLMDSNSDIEKFVSKNFHTIRGSFGVNGQAITNLDFLENLETVTSDLNIRNTDLTNLDGLDKLIYVNQLFIQENAMLADYCGLNSFIENGTINNTGDYRYIITDNLYNPTLEELQNGQCTD